MSKHNRIPRFVGYARVSSREQAENSAALEQQTARLRASGAQLILTDVESGRFGKEEVRLEFQQLMEWVRGKLLEKVVVTRLDRLSRSLPTLRKVLDDFQGAGCQLVALDDNIDLSTAAGKFHINMLGALAEMESDRLSERIRRGKEYFRQQKKVSHPPFGYIVVDQRYELDRADFLCLIADSCPYSKCDMARSLIEYYITNRSLVGTCRWFFETYGFQVFWGTGFRYWLINPAIQGDLMYLTKTKEAETHINNHDALVTREEANLIREIMIFNHRIGGYGYKRGIYPLTGLVKCVCGYNCTAAHGSRGKIKYFICAAVRYRKCDHNRWIRMDTLETAVINALTERARSVADLANPIENNDIQKETEELRDLRTQLLTLENLSTSMKVNPAIADAMQNLKEQIKEVTQQQEIQNRGAKGRMKLLMNIFASQYSDFWVNLEISQKQRFFRTLVDFVLVSNGEILRIQLKI